MNTKKGIYMSISDPLHDPSFEMESTLRAVYRRHQHIDPIVRDFNRHVTELLGACPNNTSGEWATVDSDEKVHIHISSIGDLLRLGRAFAEIARRIELEDIRKAVPSAREAKAYFEQRRLADTHDYTASVHLVPPRRNGRHRKGS